VGLKDFLQRIDRRTFLRIVSFTGITGLIYPQKLIASLIPTSSSRVVMVEDTTATSGSSINRDTVQVMIDRGVKALTNQDDLGEAWKTLFPNIHSSSTIAIKVNCRYSTLPTHPEVTYAVVDGVKQMSLGDTYFPENNIIIYDNRKSRFQQSGYTVNTSSTGVRCFDADRAVGYANQTYDVSGRNQKLSKIIADMADYLVNISVLKNHDLAGVTLCLKNHFGSCNRPRSFHHNHCDPYIPALNALSPIKSKQKINICDALFGVKSGGPGGYPQFVANKIIMSQDIVAVDYWGRQILAGNGCPTISRAHHIDTAATDYGLGTNNPSRMDVVNISNPTRSIGSRNNNSNSHYGLLQQNDPNPFNDRTQIRFYVPIPEHVQLTVFDPLGRRIRGLIDRSSMKGWHQVTWDGYSDSGKQVASDLYVCQLKAGGFQKAIIMQLAR